MQQKPARCLTQNSPGPAPALTTQKHVADCLGRWPCLHPLRRSTARGSSIQHPDGNAQQQPQQRSNWQPGRCRRRHEQDSAHWPPLRAGEGLAAPSMRSVPFVHYPLFHKGT